MEKYIKEFNSYFKTFDIRNKKILSKFHHTYRVVEYASEIALSLNLNKEDIKLVKIAALFHDISRFKQMTEYNTYDDAISFDHGDEASIIVQQFIDDLEDDKKNIIVKAIKNHNKLNIDDSLNEKELLVCRILRDADKLDIMMEQGLSINDDDLSIEQSIFDNFYKKQQIKNGVSERDVVKVLKIIAFVFDVNYKYSFKLIKDKIIDNKFNLLKANIKDDRIEKLELFVKQYIEEMIVC